MPPFVYQLLFLCDQSDYLVPLQHLATYFQSKLNHNNNHNAPANASTSRADSMNIDSDIIGNTTSIKIFCYNYEFFFST